MSRCRVGYESPWGTIQHIEQKAEGIISVSTAGHGGYWLSPERRIELLAAIPGCTPWTGDVTWLEEDCDWAYACLAWPEIFGGAACHSIVTHIKAYESVLEHVTDDYWKSARGRMVRQMADAWLAIHKNDWEMSGYSTGGEGGRVLMVRQIVTKELRSYRVPSYPEKRLFTPADLAEFELLTTAA